MGENNNKRKNYIKRTVTILVIICLGVAIGILFTPIFDVQEVYCEGNSRISSVEIIEKAQVGIGENIVFQKLRGMEKSIKEIPEIEDADVKRVFPNKLKITVAERVPAGYFMQENKCVATDIEGRVLNIIEGDQAMGIISYLTPEKLDGRPEKNEDNKEENSQDNSENNEKEEKTEENVEKQEEENGENGEGNNVSAVNIPYETPLVVGIDIKSTEVGKIVQSKEEGKLGKIFELMNCLERTGLLAKVTYLDMTNPEDIIFVIEKRLEIQLGGTDNLEYRCAFLAKVINEKISLTEHAILDYRGDDIYVRQPDDGKERVVPKPTPTPTPEPSDDSVEEDEDESEETIGVKNMEE